MNLRRTALLILLALLAVPMRPRAADAQAVLNCVSVRLHPASLRQLAFTYGLEATTITDGTINDEIGISESGDYLYGTFLVLTVPDPTTGMPAYLNLTCGLEVPDPGDANRNGISDFFEVDRALASVVSVGECVLDDGMDVYQGTLDMTWSRSAGATTGTCKLRLRIPDLGIDLTFTHVFEIYSYSGTLSYTVKGTNVTSLLTLQRVGAPGAYQGTWNLGRVDSSELSYESVELTNEVGLVLQCYGSADTEITLLRGGTSTNYYTTLLADDGWPNTSAVPEYQIWTLDIFDPNDTDHDKIPDLSDEPTLPAPKLAIRLENQQVVLELTSQPGLHATIEQSPKTAPANWTAIASFTVTNATQSITFPAPAGTQFWRAKVE